jgi:hypothetical protein
MKTNSRKGLLGLPNRKFTFSQLSKISDDNNGVLNRSMDVSGFNEIDNFELSVILIHHHAFGKHVAPHLRALVTKINESDMLASQDLTFEQWEQGEEIQKEPIKLSGKGRSNFCKRESFKKSA